MRAVAAKRERVENKAHRKKKILRFIEKRPIPAVLGPGQRCYIIDHHHLSLALWQSDVREAFVSIIADLSDLNSQRFWGHMAASGRVYPYDEWGNEVHHSQLPHALDKLRADHYRDLAWSVREEGGFKKSRAPYAEFMWAQFFRQHVSPAMVRRDYDGALEAALRLSRTRGAVHLPGYIGR